jgi:UDPglucose 6-dehydrogenase
MEAPPMRVCVAGLWHLGAVTAACLAACGHEVIGFDEDVNLVDELSRGRCGVAEPGLGDLVRAGIDASRLTFSNDRSEALAGVDVLWIAYDTPVDGEDHADVESVVRRVLALLAQLECQTFVLLSSQLPVGTTRRFAEAADSLAARIAYVPENLRLGTAIDSFMNPTRIVVGVRPDADRQVIDRLLAPITDRIDWMEVESAEMTKHALNSFLATSIAFANEVAVLCERVGADARDVARGLKSDPRIGSHAYLNPGAAFAGGTLARDIEFLTEIAKREGVPAPLLSAVRPSNTEHLQWPHRTVTSLLDGGKGSVAVWGLAYKVGTSTLRRSSALQLCTALARDGISVRAHDPAVSALPPDVATEVTLYSTAADALDGASALVVATPWPEFRAVDADEVVTRMTTPNVVDTSGALMDTLGSDTRIRYVTVGKALL